MSRIASLLTRHPAATYFTLAFAISWGGALLAIGSGGGMRGTTPASDPRFAYALVAMLGGPSVAGVLMTWLVSGLMHVSLTASLLVLNPADLAGTHLLTYSFALAGPLWIVVAVVALTDSVRADPAERRRPLPGDELIPAPLGSLTHAITIARAPHAVWPWLIQMGAGRAGWYSYDALDNGRQPSATRVVPELQRIATGTVFPALPGVTDGFTVLAFDAPRWLTLGWPGPDGAPLVTWSFTLEARGVNSTRLIVRARGARGYRFHGLPPSVSVPLVRFVHFVMERKQLLGIAWRVEAFSAPMPTAVPSFETGRRTA
jgi:hypothetical protein